MRALEDACVSLPLGSSTSDERARDVGAISASHRKRLDCCVTVNGRDVPIPDSCSAASTCAVALFDHLIGSRKQRRGGLETERLGRNQVNYEIEFGRLLDRDVAWLRPPQDFVDIASGTTE